MTPALERPLKMLLVLMLAMVLVLTVVVLPGDQGMPGAALVSTAGHTMPLRRHKCR